VPRSDKIDQILAQRAKDSAAADGLRARLSDIGAALAGIERVRADLLPRVEDDAQTMLLSFAAPLRDLSLRVTQEQAALDRVLTRLRRETLNIGMVGRARQGKSRFLQSLTGLTSREIPDGRGDFCTGVPSLIQHVPGDAPYADVFFHSTRSFISEVIGPYYDELGLGRAPGDLAGFGSRPLPALPASQGATAGTRSKYEHLADYHRTFAEYRGEIDARSPLRVGADQIRSYVAQEDNDGQRLNTFRAVRRVHIFTRFLQDDLGRLGVIDLPGLGDTKLGDDQLLLSALEDDVDLVLFLRQPNPGGDGVHDVDIALYDTAQRALSVIPMEQASFLVLNHWPSPDQARDNKRQVEDYASKAAGRGIRVVDALIANCADSGEVYNAFNPVVDYMLSHIGELDQLLLNERTHRIDEIHQEARLLAREAATLGDLAQPATLWFPLFLTLFDEMYKNLAVGLEELTERYREERDSPNSLLAIAVARTLEHARENDGIPAEAEIVRSFAVYGTRSATYGHLLDEARAHLSRHFLELDAALDECVRAMWRDVAGVLGQSGGLARLSGAQGQEFLVDLVQRVRPTILQNHGSEVRYALEVLAEFELSYRGFIQHRIRPCLDGMNADQPTVEYPHDGVRPNESVIRTMLEISYREALFGCERELNRMLAEPSGAVFAIVEEFRDRVLRSHQVADEWRAIYQEFRAEVWTERFAALGEKSADLHAWTQAVAELNALLGEGQ
jgi:hypothetical protein